MRPMVCMTPRSPRGWTRRQGSSASGEGASFTIASTVSRTSRARVARAVFPPQQVAEVKAIACELPVTHGLPLGRFSRTELHRLVLQRGVTDASASTIWRWLHDDATRAVADALVDLPARPGLRGEGRPCPGPLRQDLRGPPVAPRRVRHLRR